MLIYTYIHYIYLHFCVSWVRCLVFHHDQHDATETIQNKCCRRLRRALFSLYFYFTFIFAVLVVLLPLNFCFPLFMQLLQNSVSVAFPRLVATTTAADRCLFFKGHFATNYFCTKIYFILHFYLSVRLSVCMWDCLPILFHLCP